MDRDRQEELADVIEDTEQPTVPDSQDTPEEDEKEEDRPDPVMTAWDEHKQRPSDADIQAFKDRFGDNIYMIALDEDEMYVWRPLTRHEYKALLQAVQHEQVFMEQIVQKCVLWPTVTPEWIAGGKGGTIPTLHAVIMEGSNFLAPEVAMSLVRKL
ncbi:MAG: hypothetical protein GQ553_00905 [Nitrosomonadaceae bacterium]|nr:hypothetical protein [Nitrosomonadaceae bacterium]